MLPRVTGEVQGPLWIICEDGREYIDRFARFLDGEFRFAHATDAAALDALLASGDAAGIILDLDFRRTPGELLVDEAGLTHDAPADALRRRLAETQGLLILRRLRARGVTLRVLLFADLADASQAAWLEETLAPLAIVPGREGLAQTAARMRG